MKRLVSVERREETTKRFYQKKDSKINSFHSLANEKDTEKKNILPPIRKKERSMCVAEPELIFVWLNPYC